MRTERADTTTPTTRRRLRATGAGAALALLLITGCGTTTTGTVDADGASPAVDRVDRAHAAMAATRARGDLPLTGDGARGASADLRRTQMQPSMLADHARQVSAMHRSMTR